MLTVLPAPLRGTITSILTITNLVIWIVPFYVLALLKLLPIPALRRACFRGLEAIAALWVDGNSALAHANGVRFDIRGNEGLNYDDWYLIGTNHVSWVDVMALQRALNRRIPFLRFFVKQQLIWVPLLGLAWWAMELPFMRRHSRAEIDANPSLRLDDVEATKRACRPFRDRPTAIINFLEGTRFTPAKQSAQSSPYQHLLKPKAGGIAYALEAIGAKMNTFLDVTLVYPAGRETLWDLMTGRLRRVIIDVQRRSIPPELLSGDYGGDAEFRQRFKHWVEEIWREKDQRIQELKLEMRQALA
ncbi:MAG: acyltransferase [Pseudomonadota bacterium]